MLRGCHGLAASVSCSQANLQIDKLLSLQLSLLFEPNLLCALAAVASYFMHCVAFLRFLLIMHCIKLKCLPCPYFLLFLPSVSKNPR